MKQQGKKRNMGGLLTLLLFAVFVVCVLSVLLTGADAYQRLRQRDQSSYERRTAAQYITTKVRQADQAAMVYPAAFDAPQAEAEGDTLFLLEEVEGTVYSTRLYCHDGFLRELFADPEGEFAPGDGEKVLEAESVWFTLDGDLLTVELTDEEGQQEQFTLYLRSGEVAP